MLRSTTRKPWNMLEKRAGYFKTFVPPVVLDEVQYAPELFPYIKIIADETKQKVVLYDRFTDLSPYEKRIRVAGGKNRHHSNPWTVFERNQGKKFNMPFLPTGEYLEQSEEDAKELSQEEIWSIIQRGSMPRLYHADVDDNLWRQFYSDYVKTYIERDVRALTRSVTRLRFYNLCDFLRHRQDNC